MANAALAVAASALNLSVRRAASSSRPASSNAARSASKLARERILSAWCWNWASRSRSWCWSMMRKALSMLVSTMSFQRDMADCRAEGSNISAQSPSNLVLMSTMFCIHALRASRLVCVSLVSAAVTCAASLRLLISASIPTPASSARAANSREAAPSSRMPSSYTSSSMTPSLSCPRSLKIS